MLLKSPRRYLGGLRAGAAPSEAQRTERVLATARAFLASASLFAIWFDPTEPSAYSSLAYGLLVVYVLHSLLILGLVHIRHESTAAFVLCVHAVDILWPSSISLFTTGPNSPFFVFNVFCLLAAAYRWGFLETVATSGAAVVLYFLQAVLTGPAAISPRFLLEGEFELNRFIMRGIYLLIVGFLLGYLGEQEKLLRAEVAGIARVVSAVQGEGSLRGALRALFGEVLRFFRAGKALLVVSESDTGRLYRWEARREESGGEVVVDLAELDSPRRQIYTFEVPGLAWHARLRLLPSGDHHLHVFAVDEAGARREAARWSPPEAFLRAEQCASLLGAAVSLGSEWSGWLVVLDPILDRKEEAAVRFLQRLIGQVGPAIYAVYLTRRLRSRIGAVERARVARELHDGIIQSLIGLELQMDVLRRQANTAPATLGSELGRMQELLRQEILNLRELMQQMKPLDVAPKYLLEAIAHTVDKFRRETGIEAHFVSGLQEVPLPPRVCTDIVRIVQESLVNIRKHSGARNVLVELQFREGCYKLVIDDDGRGFDFSGRLTQAELDTARKGPVVIKERVRLIGGQLTLESVPGRGTRLEVSLPQRGYG
jgi:signal transduction histidine kinase